MNVWNRPLSAMEMIGIAVVMVLFIWLLLWQARRRSQKIAKDFLSQHPDAAVLYLYVQGLPRNDGKVVCRKGTVSQVFDAKDAPEFGIFQGIACYAVPGPVELDAEVSWRKDYYVAKRHHNMQAHLSLQAEPGCGYAAEFDQEKGNVKIIQLEKPSKI